MGLGCVVARPKAFEVRCTLLMSFARAALTHGPAPERLWAAAGCSRRKQQPWSAGGPARRPGSHSPGDQIAAARRFGEQVASRPVTPRRTVEMATTPQGRAAGALKEKPGSAHEGEDG
jgi:hypothetical protein